MNEQELVKKQLIKNMLLTLLAFTIIFTILGLIIYNQVSTSLYTSIDQELISSRNKILTGNNRNGNNKIIDVADHGVIDNINNNQNPNRNKINPRVIYIVRDSNGNILNADTLGIFYEDYLATLEFDKTIINKIYNININGTYAYRTITFEIKDENGNTQYAQLFASIEAEENIIENFARILSISIAVTIAISIIVSYILSKRTLKPIITSWRKQTEFVQNASHELRTPLTIIQAKQELLLSEPDKKIMEKSEDINLCLKETRRLSKLIKDLMMLARADSNEITLIKEKTNIDEFIKEITVPYIDFANIDDKKIELDLKYGKELNIDKSKFHQLLVIVLDNAIKYTEEKDTITISTSLKDGKLNLEIKDTGIGISKEGLKRAFERFYRDDKARNRQTRRNRIRTIISTLYSNCTWRNNKIITK